MPAYHPHSCRLESSRGGQSVNRFIYVFDSTGEMIGAFRDVVKVETVEKMVAAVNGPVIRKSRTTESQPGLFGSV